MTKMKKHILRSCAIMTLAFAATLSNASAQQGAGGEPIEGVWLSRVTPVDCNTRQPISGAPVFRGLNMFIHDGSFSNEAAFPVPVPLRSGGLGNWQHTQAHMYTASFRFFRYQESAPGLFSFLVLRKVKIESLLLDGDTFTSFDVFQDYDLNNNPLNGPGNVGCNREDAVRVQ